MNKYSMAFICLFLCFVLKEGHTQSGAGGLWPDPNLLFAADETTVPGHEDGKPVHDMYQCFREPVAVKTSTGRIIVGCHAGNKLDWPERSGQDYVIKYSDDGGKTWSVPTVHPDLKVTKCNGSMVTIRYQEGRLTSTLLFSIPSPGGRKEGWIYLSKDGGESWPLKHQPVAGFFAYSSLIQVGPDTICFFNESNHYKDICLMLIPVKKLKDPEFLISNEINES